MKEPKVGDIVKDLTDSVLPYCLVTEIEEYSNGLIISGHWAETIQEIGKSDDIFKTCLDEYDFDIINYVKTPLWRTLYA